MPAVEFETYARGATGLRQHPMPSSQKWIMPHLLKMSTLKRSSPIAVLIGIKCGDSPLHEAFPGEGYARIMMSSILNLVAALNA